MNRSRRILILAALLLFCQDIVLAYDDAIPDLQTIAVTYGTPINGVRFNSLSTPTISDDGIVGFRPTIYDLGSPYNRQIWTAIDAGDYTTYVAEVAEGDPAPGYTAATFDSFIWLALSDHGRMAFYGKVEGPEINELNDSGIWAIDDSGALRAVAVSGQVAPNTSLVFDPIYKFSTGRRTPGFVQNQSGRIAFGANLNDPGDPNNLGYGIWAEDESGILQAVAVTGQTVAGYADGTRFTNFSTKVPQINDQGLTTFLALTNCPGDGDQLVAGIWKQRDATQILPVVEVGAPAPGARSGAIFHDFFDFSINSHGQTAYVAELKAFPDEVQNQSGIWLTYDAGQTIPIAIQSTIAPGTNGAQFGGFTPVGEKSVFLNGAGSVAFISKLQGVETDRDTGLWCRRADGTLELIAREGDFGPDGTAYGDFSLTNAHVSINSRGQVAFSLSGKSIWAEDLEGNLQVIAKAGQTIDVDEGPGVDMRTFNAVNFLDISGGEDGFPRGFNDRGQLTFYATLNNYGSGVFLSSLVAVPEPSSVSFLMLSLFFCRAGRCRLTTRNSF